jgi:hypothetical protein
VVVPEAVVVVVMLGVVVVVVLVEHGITISGPLAPTNVFCSVTVTGHGEAALFTSAINNRRKKWVERN